MNKIRKYLIHLLGGVTEEYCDRKIDYFTSVERVNAINSVLLMMQRCYGMPNDEWVNYPRAKDSWASGFAEKRPFKRLALTSSPPV